MVQVRALAALARAHAQDADPAAGIRAAMWQQWLAAARAHGCRQTDEQLAEFLAGDLDLNTQGLVVWLQREQRA
jgi:flagellar biosynthesis regulator FlaF